MPGRDAILCSDCALLFTAERPEPSILSTILVPVPQNHRLRLLLSTDVACAEGLANDCHFCSVMVRMRSRSSQLKENGSKSISTSQTRDISLFVLGPSSSQRDDHGTIDIFEGKGLWSRDLFQNSTLVMFEPTDSRISNLHELDPASTTTSSDASFATLARWISTCEEKHHLCQPPTGTSKVETRGWLPSRLVQIDSSSVRVIKTADHSLTADSRYATLSYCWGPPPITFTRLLRANIEDMNTGIDVATLPKTFQDAIAATSLLGLNFVWIDALCIIQDSDEDWRIESMQMSEVYSRAHINLAAVASVDAHGGLFRARNPFSLNPFVLKFKRQQWRFEGSFCCIPKDPWIGAIRDSPLFTRAWTFQERLLSARTVYFAQDQLYWECGELCASEIFPLGSPFDPGPVRREKPSSRPRRLLDDSYEQESGRIKREYASLKSLGVLSIDSPRFLELWALLVENYSKARLTFPRDRLVAISGVARQLAAHETERNYYVGLWRPYICHLLLWRDLGPGDTSEGQDSLVSTRLGPSWSWSSHMNPVNYSRMLIGSWRYSMTNAEICAEVLDIDVTPGTTPFTQDGPESGRLVLKAPLIKAKLSKLTGITRNSSGPLSRPFYEPFRGIFGKALREWAPFFYTREYVLLFTGKGVRSSFMNAHIDSGVDVASLSDVFCVKLANAGATNTSVDNATHFGLILSHTGNKGQYIRVGCFLVLNRDLARSWRADRLRSKLRTRSLENLNARLFHAGDLEPCFYQDFDGVGAYTIEII